MSIADCLLQLDVCSKCGEPVMLENNGALFDLFVHEHPTPFLAVSLTQAFHLLPVIKDGRTVCPGSPSRFQYLAGQPRDPRPQIHYRPEREPIKRAAFAQMQKLCPTPAT